MVDEQPPEGSNATPAEEGEDGLPAEARGDGFGPPFVEKTFGAALIWARAPGYIATILRVREGENVVVSTRNRRDMNVILTGGRALLEIHDGTEIDRVELMPATPVSIQPGRDYRLLAMTEVELFTVYTPL
jgi:hypothetical protein